MTQILGTAIGLVMTLVVLWVVIFAVLGAILAHRMGHDWQEGFRLGLLGPIGWGLIWFRGGEEETPKWDRPKIDDEFDAWRGL